MVRRRVLIMLNPSAGQGMALAKAVKYLAANSDLHPDLVIPHPANFASQVAEARAEIGRGVDAVIVHGGDGAVNTGVNLVAGRGIPLGIVPSGTGNDFARAAGIDRREPVRELERILTALSRPRVTVRDVDGLHLDIRSDSLSHSGYVANSINVGFDARVNQVANRMTKVPGSLRYLAALLRVIPDFTTATYRVSRDGSGPTPLDSALVCIHNGPYIGGGIRMVKDGVFADGLATLTTVTTSSKIALATLFPLIYLGAHDLLTPLGSVNCATVDLTVPAGIPIYADGDEISGGLDTPARLAARIEPAAVKLLR